MMMTIFWWTWFASKGKATCVTGSKHITKDNKNSSNYQSEVSLAWGGGVEETTGSWTQKWEGQLHCEPAGALSSGPKSFLKAPEACLTLLLIYWWKPEIMLKCIAKAAEHCQRAWKCCTRLSRLQVIGKGAAVSGRAEFAILPPMPSTTVVSAV